MSTALPLKALPSYWLVSIALGFFTSSRIAEQVRAGIQALPTGQRAAATALGLTTTQSYRYVILPMALRIVIPPLTSECMNLIKNSSVAFAVSVPELTLFAMQAQEETSHGPLGGNPERHTVRPVTLPPAAEENTSGKHQKGILSLRRDGL